MSECQSPESTGASEAEMITISISYRKQGFDLKFSENATIMDLFEEIGYTFDMPWENIKIIVPKAPLLKWQPKDPHLPVATLQGKKLILMGSGAATVEAVQNMSATVAHRNAVRAAQRAAQRASNRSTASKRRNPTTSESKYTFMQVEPLRNLPGPERSRKLLMRLKEDPGIVAVMRKHKFIVSMLTEMEPLSNTQSNHEGTSRILGLNRNKGEVIELRLRTDAYDGYRDYKTIRKTLCHELTHNVHSDHDRHFWDLCHQIEKEVDAADWKTGGHTIGETSRYHVINQDDEEDHEDQGGWTGGEFVLGGVKETPGGMSRRDILAKAATERQRKDDEAEQKADKGWRPCQRPHRSDEAQ